MGKIRPVPTSMGILCQDTLCDEFVQIAEDLENHLPFPKK